MKILVNGVTLEEGNIVPLLSKIKTWQDKDSKISIVGNKDLKEQIKKISILKKEYKFIELTGTKKIKDKFSLIFEGLKRNLRLIKTINDYSDFDIVYSVSSVIDLTLFPFFLKMVNKKIKWVTVFDNIVPLNDPGNRIVRFLAWLFFHFSLILLRKADCIFVISEDLKNYFIQGGFDRDKVVLTGNAVEADLIKKAKKDNKYNIDALFIGRINEAKGLEDMLNVLGLVKKKYPNFQLGVVGKGDTITEKKFKKEIKDRRLEKNVQFLGYQIGLEKFNIIKSSKIFLFLSKRESFGVALLEAACCGVKAFAYDLEPYKKIYRHDEVSFFPVGDYKSVGMTIIKTFDEKSFGNSNGQLLVNKYSWDKIAKIERGYFDK